MKKECLYRHHSPTVSDIALCVDAYLIALMASKVL